MKRLTNWVREFLQALTEYQQLKDPKMVVLTILNNRDRATGLQMELLVNKSGYTLGVGSLYPLLKRMERQEGLLTYQSLIDTEGRTRGYYSITDRGQQELQVYEEFLSSLK